MLRALSKGISQLQDPGTRKFVWISIFTALITFFVLWSSIGYLLAATAVFDIGWLESIVDYLGIFATALFTWFLFPGVVTAVIGLFLDKIVDAVEALHYPHLAPADGQPFVESLVGILKFFATLVLVNIVVLLFLFIPPLFPFVFYAANGYLLSREYFELVALRRMSQQEARALRKSVSTRLLIFGAGMAFMLTVPIINLLVPLVAAATMVHLFEGWRTHPSRTLKN